MCDYFKITSNFARARFATFSLIDNCRFARALSTTAPVRNITHREHLNKVFAQIQEFGFKVKEAKCDFCMNKIKYLGHIIDKDGRCPDPEKPTAMKDMSAPDNVTTLQSFLGLANYYQSFIKYLHDLPAPLNELLKKDKKLRWTPECQTAFDQIKKIRC